MGGEPLSGADDRAALAAIVFCKASSFCSFSTNPSTSRLRPCDGIVLFNVSMYWAISTIWSAHCCLAFQSLWPLHSIPSLPANVPSTIRVLISVAMVAGGRRGEEEAGGGRWRSDREQR